MKCIQAIRTMFKFRTLTDVAKVEDVEADAKVKPVRKGYRECLSVRVAVKKIEMTVEQELLG